MMQKMARKPLMTDNLVVWTFYSAERWSLLWHPCGHGFSTESDGRDPATESPVAASDIYQPAKFIQVQLGRSAGHKPYHGKCVRALLMLLPSPPGKQLSRLK